MPNQHTVHERVREREMRILRESQVEMRGAGITDAGLSFVDIQGASTFISRECRSLFARSSAEQYPILPTIPRPKAPFCSVSRYF
jgi:hypothetical protein